MKKFDLKKKVMLAVLAGNMLCMGQGLAANTYTITGGASGEFSTASPLDATTFPATGNTVTFNVDTNYTSNLEGSLAGYASFVGGNVQNNHVTVTITNNAVIRSNLVGAATGDRTAGGTASGNVSGNSITVDGGIFNADTANDIVGIAGGLTLKGNAANNSVTVDNVNTSSAGIVGGYTREGNLSGNSVTINGGNLGKVYGGFMDCNDTSTNAATGNYVVINNCISESVWCEIVGADTWGPASGNYVLIKNGTIKASRIYGGDGRGEINNNYVQIENGLIRTDDIRGGDTNGSAEGNYVTIKGGTFEYDGETFVYGGYVSSGGTFAKKNSVTIDDGVFNSEKTSVFGTRINAPNGTAGGNTADDGNKVVVNGGNFTGARVTLIGAYAQDSASNSLLKNNSVTINGGNFGYGKQVHIYGGYGSSAGNIEHNTVTITGGNFKGGTYTDILIQGGSRGKEINDNKIVITGGSFENFSIYGARHGSIQKRNSVEIKGGIFKGYGNTICGSNPYESLVQENWGNSVILEGGIFIGDTDIVVANYNSEDSYTYNTLTIKNPDSGTNALDLSGATLRGYAYYGSRHDRELNVNRTDVKVGAINNFYSINFNLAGFSSDDIVFRMQNTLDLSLWNVNGINVTGLTLTSGDYITLIKNVEGTFSGDVYTNGTLGGNVKVLEGDLIYYTGTEPTEPKQSSYVIIQGNNKWECINSSGNPFTESIKGNVAEGGLSATSYSNNQIYVSKGTYNAYIYGAYADANNVESNKVTINGGTFNSSVYGASTSNGTAIGNIVNIYDGIFSESGGIGIYGGGASNGASENTVNISGGTFKAVSSLSYTAIYGGCVWGAAAADGNKVEITGGTFEGSSEASLIVCVGTSQTGSATNNQFKAYLGTFGDFASITAGNGTTEVTGNTVEIGGTVTFGASSEISGGESMSGNISKNTVTVSGGSFANSTSLKPTKIYGGYASWSGNVGSETEGEGNIVNILGGIFGDYTEVIGGKSNQGAVKNNIVNVSSASFGSNNLFYGGHSTAGNANFNTLNISSGTFGPNAKFYGGYSESGGANSNTVNIIGGSFANDFYLYGGHATTSTANTLNLEIKMGGKAKEVNYFQKMNFTLPSNIANGDAMLSTASVNYNGATIGVAAASGVSLKKDNIVYLIKADTAEGTISNTGDNLVVLNGAGQISLTDNNLILTLLKDFNAGEVVIVSDENQQKAPVEGVAAAAVTVNASADLAGGEGMASLLANTAGGTTDTFGASSAGNSTYKTGSHVDSKGWGLLVGAGKTKNWKNGTATTYGLFFEYGRSDFDTYNNGVHGEGDSNNKGVGIMLRHKLRNNTYYEGNIRYGKVETEWSQSEIGGYDMNNRYYGIMVGMGHIFPAGKNEIDVYGRYMFGHTEANDATIGANHYHFDSVKSHRIRVGGKYNFVQKNGKAKPYVGLALEREFKGESRASISGFGEAPAPSMKGNVGILEVGCDWEVSRKWSVGLGAEAYTGKRRGWNGMAKIFYNF